MKLYTQEQVINSMKSVKYYIEHYDANVIDTIIDKHLKALQPIELPSDEDIKYTSELNLVEPYASYWRTGTKWVIEQIKQQDRDQ
jgi:hypothetical protein